MIHQAATTKRLSEEEKDTSLGRCGCPRLDDRDIQQRYARREKIEIDTVALQKRQKISYN